VKEETLAQTSTECERDTDAECTLSAVTTNTQSMATAAGRDTGGLDSSDGREDGSSSSSMTVTTMAVETSSAKDVAESGSGSGSGLLSPRRRIIASSERWTQDVGEEVTTFSTVEEMSKTVDSLTTVMAGAEQKASFSGGSTRQSVDAEQVVMASHEETRRFFVKTVIDPRDGQHLAMEQVFTG